MLAKPCKKNELTVQCTIFNLISIHAPIFGVLDQFSLNETDLVLLRMSETLISI